MSARLFVEGGGDSKELHIRCRRGFAKLLENCGFAGRMPRVDPCGGNQSAFDDFKTALRSKRPHGYVAMLIDSENPVANIDQTWRHLATSHGWHKPVGAHDDQVLLMTTCMETWIVSDREALTAHYRPLQVSALPPLVNMENRSRHAVQDCLVHATRNCSNAYAKGKRSFEVLAKLNPTVLEQHLPSFKRIRTILRKKL